MGSAAGGDELEWRVWVDCSERSSVQPPKAMMVMPKFTYCGV